jgi:single-stranded-DNA-specific exonuclease
MREPEADVWLDERDNLAQVLLDLERLEPCGHDNPAPRIWIPEAEVLAAREVKGHLKLELRIKGQRLSGFAPELADARASVAGKKLALTTRLKRDSWRGGDLPEVLVERFS